jgi:hypothetical protein
MEIHLTQDEWACIQDALSDQRDRVRATLHLWADDCDMHGRLVAWLQTTEKILASIATSGADRHEQ